MRYGVVHRRSGAIVCSQLSRCVRQRYRHNLSIPTGHATASVFLRVHRSFVLDESLMIQTAVLGKKLIFSAAVEDLLLLKKTVFIYLVFRTYLNENFMV